MSLNSYGKHFWWSSALATLITIGTLLSLYEWHSRRLIMEAETRSDLQFVQTLGNLLWTKHSAFIEVAKNLSKDQLRARPEQAQLFDTVKSAVHDSHVLKVKIFAPGTAVTLFATEAAQIGDSKHGSSGLQAALRGEHNAELTHRDTFNAIFGVIKNRDVVASYIPFYQSGRPRAGQPDMIVEVYTDVTGLVDSHKASRTQIILVLGGALSLIYAVIFVFGRRATSALRIAETRRKRLDARIRHQAYHDGLTGLSNRACFVENVRAKQTSQAINILYVNLDRFKVINDGLGQKAGDQALAIVAERLSKAVKSKDQVFRVGGDEFVILQKNSDVIRGHLLAQNVIKCIAPAFEVDGTQVSLTVSVGVATWPEHDASLEGVARCADIALNAAKRAGSNQLAVYQPDMGEAIDAQATLMADMQRAYADSEFVLHYQPRMNGKIRHIESVEALIRWNHPQRGLLYPDAFIAALEDSPLIIEVGQWVLESACAQTVRWHREGMKDLNISVNVAPKQFRHAGFVSVVESALKSSGLPAKFLEIELTEGQLIGDLDAAIQVLEALKKIGVSVSIDDFGTGYSSLSYLHRLPINCVKIDRSFVSDIRDNPQQGKIAQTIAILAHNLGLSVVAEGVETSYQADALASWGCDQLQGYFFSKPVPASAISRLFAEAAVPQADMKGVERARSPRDAVPA
jgi:diguanylate cyclase (GGDEF)-like protein